MKDIMLDFETFGNGENKCLCQIGAVYFDNVTGELGEEFKANIDAQSHMDRGGVLDAKTVYWWLQQSDAARQSLLPERKDVMEVMLDFNKFIAPCSRIWSHATFDFVTLIETFRKLHITPSVSHKAGLDLRTLTYLANITIDSFAREGVHHEALADAKHQVKYCVAALQAVKTNKTAIKFLQKLGE